MKAVLNIALMRKMAKLGPISQMKAPANTAINTAVPAHTASDQSTSTRKSKSNSVHPDSAAEALPTKKKSRCVVC